MDQKPPFYNLVFQIVSCHKGFFIKTITQLTHKKPRKNTIEMLNEIIQSAVVKFVYDGVEDNNMCKVLAKAMHHTLSVANKFYRKNSKWFLWLKEFHQFIHCTVTVFIPSFYSLFHLVHVSAET